MAEQEMSEAFGAIQDIAAVLLERALPDEVIKGLQRIVEIARDREVTIDIGESPAEIEVSPNVPVKSEEFDHRGLKYQIKVETYQDGFRGFLHCDLCNADKCHVGPCDSVESAVTTARIMSIGHSFIRHNDIARSYQGPNLEPYGKTLWAPRTDK
jgi:hypothetical protein